MATHPGARYGGPAWLLAGAVVYGLVRKGRGEGLLEHVERAARSSCPRAQFSSILVPMKLGAIGEEMIATAVKLARDRGAHVEALYVIRVPLDQSLEAELDDQEEARRGLARRGAPARRRQRRRRRRSRRFAPARSATRSSARPGGAAAT